MLRNTIFASLIASSALTLVMATPAAAANTTDRAREAIAAAEAKIHTAEAMGAAADAPRDTAAANAALAQAKEDFAIRHRDVAIEEAFYASARADAVIGMVQQHKNAALGCRARQPASHRRKTARDQVDRRAERGGRRLGSGGCQLATRPPPTSMQAEDPNARADAAQQSAAASAADAAAARNAAAIAVSRTPPAPGG